MTSPRRKRAATGEAGIIGIDLAKRRFEVPGAGADGA
jgi:hypothetical protein